MSPQLKYVIIIGRGRSGTSWIGGIMNTYYHCFYKYEPFLKYPYCDWFDNLNKLNAEELRKQFALLCRQCYHGIDMPPFFPKSFRPRSAILLHALYTLSNRVRLCKGIYEWYGKPRFGRLKEDIPILIKQVNLPNEMLPYLCHVLEPKLIGLIRNPFANIASHLVGTREGLFKGVRPKPRFASVKKRAVKGIHTIRIERLKKEIIQSGNNDFLKYLDDLGAMSPESLSAVGWRVRVEPMVEFVQNYDKGLLLVYEDVCKNPFESAKRLFDFSGWEMTDFTRNYIQQTTTERKREKSRLKSYYSVFKNPEESMNKWKTQLTTEQKRDIALIIKDSPLRGFWTDMPL